jgi:two-component system, chemotaxis family, sensor kinase CheA
MAAADPYKYFRLEARDLADQLAKGVLELERGGDSGAIVQRLLRLAHTLKGAARVVKLQEIAEQAHAIEDVLAPSREPPHAVAREQIEQVLKRIDDIAGRIPGTAPAAAADAPRPAAPAAEERLGLGSVRADVADMDAVLDGVAETHALLGGLRTAARSAEQAERLADVLQAQLAPRRTAEQGRQPSGSPERLFSLAEELRRGLGGLERNLVSVVDQMDRELGQLREAVEQLRLTSAGTLFTSLERTARDTAQALSKDVVFDGRGGDVRLDSQVLGRVQGALVQIVRNAVAHGIEPARERQAAGKPPAGRVSVEVSRRGRRIVFECRDDGRGIDLEAVRRVAADRGLAGSAAGGLGAEDLFRLLLRGGISTAGTVTAIAGRGVGLDVVREAIERLGGEVQVRSAAGKGTVLELVVPATLASTEALIVEASGTTVAIPLDAVRGSIHVGAAEISRGASGASVVYERNAIPFVPLSRSLDPAARLPGARDYTSVIVAGEDGLAAVGVDRLRGTMRIVVRPLPQHAAAKAIVAGASLDAEGNPQLVLDPDGLVAEARRGDAAALEPTPPALPVLVIDDSLTTRMLEQSILESAGYEVDLALSGEEGLESARRKRYALFLVDVEMPGMDGFTFIERIRADPELNRTPAILVTSRANPEDLQRGKDVGAQGYVIKSDFNQARLLSMIRPLVG